MSSKGGKKYRLFSLFLLLLIFVLGVSFVFAQKELEVEYPTVPGAETPTTTQTALPNFVKYIFNFSIIIAGLIAFASIIYGGFCYLTSAGDPTKTKDCRDRIFAGLLGLIILLSSYLILTTINPQLVVLNITPEIAPALPEGPGVTLPDKPTLTATEIPIGKLIDGVGNELTQAEKDAGGSPTSPIFEYEGVLAHTRLKRILELSEEIWQRADEAHDLSERIRDAAEEIKLLTDQCHCGICNTECGGCPGCPCTDICRGSEPFPPCPNHVKGQIINQQTILRNSADDLEPYVDILNDLRDELTMERGKLLVALGELERAEAMAMGCFFSMSDQGRFQDLLNLDNFGPYKQLVENKNVNLIEEIKIEHPWENVAVGEDSATFYCAETILTTSMMTTIEGSEESFTEVEQELLKNPPVCEDRMPIGYIIFNTKDIAQRLIDISQRMASEIPIITGRIPIEAEQARDMADLPNECECDPKCTCECIPCCCCAPLCCCSCTPTCIGTACPYSTIASTLRGIIRSHCIITAAFDNITVADDEVHNLIEGDEIHNGDVIGVERRPTWAYNIINEELPSSRQNFAGCILSSEDWEAFLSGESIILDKVWKCENLPFLLVEPNLMEAELLKRRLEEECSFPCVPFSSCESSGSGDNCETMSDVYTNHRWVCDTVECVQSEEPERYLAVCETRTLYIILEEEHLEDEDICDLQHFCCNEINNLCCERD